jgi:hypothetical protein
LFRKSPDHGFTIGAFLCLLLTTSINAQPFLTQDQNPFSLIHGQPQPVAAKLPASGNTQWSLTLDITNTLNSDSSNTESLLLDFESYNLRYSLLHGLNDNWAIKIDIPIIHYGRGFLDNTIDNWHDFFGLPRANRPYVADDQYRIKYVKNGQTQIDFNTPHSDLGDIQIALGKSIIEQEGSALSLWLATDLPTGEASSLIGNDSSDLSVWLAGEYQLSDDWLVDTNLGILFPGKNQLSSLIIEDQVYFAHAGIEWQLHELIDLRIQLNGHSSFYANSHLKLLGSAYSMVFGGRIHVTDCSDIDLAFSEDVQVGATPDVSFLFTWRSRTDCQ